MTDPERWLDNEETADGLKRTLGAARRARHLDDATRARVGVRLSRLGAVPFTAITWLSLKSAAALGLAGGATVAGVIAVVEHHAASVAISAPSTTPSVHAPVRARSAPPPPASVEPVAPTSAGPTIQAPELEAPADAQRAPARPAAAESASSAGGLAAESALLEQARRALASAPNASLALVEEHATRFPSGQLAAERRLIEVDALYRAGRRAEARALAQKLLARGGDDLYVGRVEQLLQKIDATP